MKFKITQNPIHCGIIQIKILDAQIFDMARTAAMTEACQIISRAGGKPSQAIELLEKIGSAAAEKTAAPLLTGCYNAVHDRGWLFVPPECSLAADSMREILTQLQKEFGTSTWTVSFDQTSRDYRTQRILFEALGLMEI